MMENFKAVEKAMKTKAYSKEGLSAAAKLDPKELAKSEACDFLSQAVDELERQIETLEAEAESIQATLKKGKGHSSKAERIATIESITEKHKWHQGRLELIKRSLENGGVETKEVNDLEDSIKYYLTDGMTDDYMDDETMYDDLNLQEDEENYGMNNDNDRVSSQDTQSIQDETPEPETRTNVSSGKSKSVPEPAVAVARRPSTQIKSPLPALATLHTASTNSNGTNSHMMGIAPLPPPPEALPAPSTSSSHPPLPSHRRPSVTASPTAVFSQPTSVQQTPVTKPSVPATSQVSDTPTSAKSPALSASSIPATSRPVLEQQDSRPGASRGSSGKAPAAPEASVSSKVAPQQTNGITNGTKGAPVEDQDESIFHLPSGLEDLLQSFEGNARRSTLPPSQSSQRMLSASLNNFPETMDGLPPRNYKPKNPIRTPSYYPQELNSCFDDARLYSRIDPDTLFYVFYYKQETYQQYLAAKALKDQSWRFHKQYQTWFQRHEEPKTITEEFE